MRALGHNCMLERIAQSSASDRDLSEVLAHALAPTFLQWFRFAARLEGASVSKDRKDILRQHQYWRKPLGSTSANTGGAAATPVDAATAAAAAAEAGPGFSAA